MGMRTASSPHLRAPGRLPRAADVAVGLPVWESYKTGRCGPPLSSRLKGAFHFFPTDCVNSNSDRKYFILYLTTNSGPRHISVQRQPNQIGF